MAFHFSPVNKYTVLAAGRQHAVRYFCRLRIQIALFIQMLLAVWLQSLQEVHCQTLVCKKALVSF